MVEFFQTFNVKLTPMFSKLFHKIEREGPLSNSLHESSITLIPKLDKGATKIKL
jgi:hypothetical protein